MHAVLLYFVLLWLYNQFLKGCCSQFTPILQDYFIGKMGKHIIAPIACEVTQKAMGKSDHFQRATKDNKACNYTSMSYIYTTNRVYKSLGCTEINRPTQQPTNQCSNYQVINHLISKGHFNQWIHQSINCWYKTRRLGPFLLWTLFNWD